MYLLDTVTVSELRKGQDRADPGVVEWNGTVSADHTHLSVVTLRELRTGALLVDRRDPHSGSALLRWVDHVAAAYAGRVLPIDAAIAEVCAAIHVPHPKPAEDAWIAATASVHGLTVVTRNTTDFATMDVPVHNPWRSPQPPA